MSPIQRPVERIAHRGASREFPENTIPAFERALERGADAIELDVHATVDGVVVVHHDPSLAGIADPTLASREIVEMPWAVLQTVELAPGISVPSLSQVLDLVRGRAMVYVELKGHAIEATVADVIAESPTRCAVHSFDHAAVSRSSRVAPGIRRGVLFDQTPDDLDGILDDTAALDVWPHWRLIDARLVDDVHGRGGRVVAWTVNDVAEARRLVSLGVDGICTDDVRLLAGL